MKKSLIWRSLVVIVVVAAWGTSIFPLQNRPLFKVFKEMASAQIETYRNKKEEAQQTLEKTKSKLSELEQQEGSEYEKLKEKKKKAQENVEKHSNYIEDFNNLLDEAHQLLEEDETVRAPYQAIEEAAKEKPEDPPVPLKRYINVPFNQTPSNAVVVSHVRQKCRAPLSLGLDLRGGTEFIIGFDEDDLEKKEDPQSVRDQITTILRNRVNRLGVSHPEIKPVGPSSISLRMPAVSEGEKADLRQTIKQTAKLTFHLIHENNRDLVQKYKAYKRDQRDTFDRPRGYSYKVMTKEESDGSVKRTGLFIRERPTRVRGAYVRKASATTDPYGSYYVNMRFNGKGAKTFAEVTSEHTGERLAVVLDGKVYSAPVIREAITGGSAQISGQFSAEEAKRLASVISCGNLPTEISIDSEFGTDPTLGKDSIQSGKTATIIALVVVFVFMIAYYHIAGIVASLALAVNIVLVLGTLALTQATLTLPGIAGIVLTIGMAVDANVLIFERIREEIKKGKSLKNAISAGYRRAFLTIFDANLTTFLTALILFKFGTGPIRGFAVTLSIGIVASMFTALFMTRIIFDALVYGGKLQRLTMFSIVKDPNYNFLVLKRFAVFVSTALLLVSLVSTGFRGGEALSIDFKGGTAITYQIDAEDAPEIEALRNTVQQAGFTESKLVYKYSSQADKQLLELTLPGKSTDAIGGKLETLRTKLNDTYTNTTFTQGRTRSIGSLIGKEFRNRAIIAAILAMIVIIIYITFRFEFAFGVASVAALVHDVAITIGIFLLLGRQLSLPTVGALLTIIGYSLNDTIVLFDRIREDLELIKKKSYQSIINLSINHVLSRTILTSVTTILVVGSLLIFGGGVITDFSLILLIGVLLGTYSSIFVASTLVALWHKPTEADSISESSQSATQAETQTG